ncbi:hypothetical protein [Kitasatospora sp. NPDC015120]|uniref:hypothetical protein n=1 Tax=Kitasatospora sp. NPDC015120 TaxID=3364023 RepID=UPI0036F47466
MYKLGVETGMDFSWASRNADVLAVAGHQEVTVRDYQAPGQGGEPTALLARLHSSMLEPCLLSQASLTAADLAVIRETLIDPEFEMLTNQTKVGEPGRSGVQYSRGVRRRRPHRAARVRRGTDPHRLGVELPGDARRTGAGI